MWPFRYQFVLTDKRYWQELNHCGVYVSYHYYIIYYSTIIICVILDYPPDNLKWAVKPVNKGTDSKVVSVSVCVCVCVCMYRYVFVCVCVHVFVYVCVCSSVSWFVYMFVCVCDFAYMYMWVLCVPLITIITRIHSYQWPIHSRRSHSYCPW